MTFFSILVPFASFLATTVIGLGIWRYQLIAQRKYQIADEALAAADQAVVDITSIRRAISDARLDVERHPDAIPVQPWAATSARLQEASPHFENFVTAMKSVERHFGKEAAKPFHELKVIYDRICEAQNGLYFRGAPQRMYPTPEDVRQLEDWKRTVEDQGNADPITLKADIAQKAINERFRKHLHPNILRLFLPV